jgi:hypothetical protein
MARIVLGSYMVRYPMGGMMSWVLQYLVGLERLGHEVYLAEKSGYPKSCYDPVRDTMSDDPTYGIRIVDRLLSRFDLQDRWCFIDAGGGYHGLSRGKVEAMFGSADLFIDMGTHGDWLPDAERTGLKVLVDGEPAFTQMKMENRSAAGEILPDYDHYYTTGRNIGTAKSSAPTAGKTWKWLFHPVVVDLFPASPPDPGAPFTTVMNWQSYEPVHYRGTEYGHKDVEFLKFVDLPAMTGLPLEVALSGKKIPRDRLVNAGWRTRNAHDVTISFDSFVRYIERSRGEFSVCKGGYVATNSGWFSDRSAAYLATGRPVVMQETGFSAHLPCGEGLFAVRTAQEAAEALEGIEADFDRHARRAREIAVEYLDTGRVLGRFLEELGV